MKQLCGAVNLFVGLMLVAGSASAKSKKGEPCNTGGDCISTHCVDHVCCGSACEGPCKQCNLPNNKGVVDGVCRGVINRTDPHHDCGPEGAPCSGVCATEDGFHYFCARPGPETSCGV